MQVCQSEGIKKGLLSAERHAKELVFHCNRMSLFPPVCPGCRGVSSMLRLALPPDPFTRIHLTAWSCCQSVKALDSSLTCKDESCRLTASVPLWQPFDAVHKLRRCLPCWCSANSMPWACRVQMDCEGTWIVRGLHRVRLHSSHSLVECSNTNASLHLCKHLQVWQHKDQDGMQESGGCWPDEPTSGSCPAMLASVCLDHPLEYA